MGEVFFTRPHIFSRYSECFANGEFCNNCNCNNCHNNIENEKQRQKAIKQCLDRNPSAFKPKVNFLKYAFSKTSFHSTAVRKLSTQGVD